jgi:hypothetical protein
MRQWLLAAAIGALAGAGCAHAQAQTPVQVPSLAVPEPPDRLIVPVVLADAPEPVPVTPPPPSAAPRPRDAPARPAQPPERTPATAPPAAAEPVAPNPAPQLLQTAANPVEVERQVRAQLAAAQRDLDRVTSKPLSPSGRVQVDTARGFIRQADEALKLRNIMLARDLADKAASLASQLAR